MDSRFNYFPPPPYPIRTRMNLTLTGINLSLSVLYQGDQEPCYDQSNLVA